MINVVSSKGVVDYGHKEFILDTPEDLNNLPKFQDCSPGSTAFIISTSQVYMKNGQGEWLEV